MKKTIFGAVLVAVGCLTATMAMANYSGWADAYAPVAVGQPQVDAATGDLHYGANAARVSVPGMSAERAIQIEASAARADHARALSALRASVEELPPAVLAIVATRQGTSMQVIENDTGGALERAALVRVARETVLDVPARDQEVNALVAVFDERLDGDWNRRRDGMPAVDDCVLPQQDDLAVAHAHLGFLAALRWMD